MGVFCSVSDLRGSGQKRVISQGGKRLRRRHKNHWKEEILSFQTVFPSSPEAFTILNYGPVLLEHILNLNAFGLNSEQKRFGIVSVRGRNVGTPKNKPDCVT